MDRRPIHPAVAAVAVLLLVVLAVLIADAVFGA